MEAASRRSPLPAAPVPAATRDRFGDAALHWVTDARRLRRSRLIGLIIYKVVDGAWPAIRQFGLPFIWHHTWNAP